MGLIESIDKLSAWLKRRREEKRPPIIGGTTWGQSSKPFWTTEPTAMPAIPVSMPTKHRGVREARKWLANNPSPDPFWTDHFVTKENAQKLVEELYRAGASSVKVSGLLRDRNGEYADVLLVRAPKGKKRLLVQQILRRHGPYSLKLVKGAFRAWWD